MAMQGRIRDFSAANTAGIRDHLKAQTGDCHDFKRWQGNYQEYFDTDFAAWAHELDEAMSRCRELTYIALRDEVRIEQQVSDLCGGFITRVEQANTRLEGYIRALRVLDEAIVPYRPAFSADFSAELTRTRMEERAGTGYVQNLAAKNHYKKEYSLDDRQAEALGALATGLRKNGAYADGTLLPSPAQLVKDTFSLAAKGGLESGWLKETLDTANSSLGLFVRENVGIAAGLAVDVAAADVVAGMSDTQLLGMLSGAAPTGNSLPAGDAVATIGLVGIGLLLLLGYLSYKDGYVYTTSSGEAALQGTGENVEDAAEAIAAVPEDAEEADVAVEEESTAVLEAETSDRVEPRVPTEKEIEEAIRNDLGNALRMDEHILQDKHLWNRLVPDPHDPSSQPAIHEGIRAVLMHGTKCTLDQNIPVFSSVMNFSGHTVEVIYLWRDEVFRISNAWIRP